MRWSTLPLLIVLAAWLSRVHVNAELEIYETPSKIGSPLSVVQWSEPYSVPIYCVSDSSNTSLRWTCPNCDEIVDADLLMELNMNRIDLGAHYQSWIGLNKFNIDGSILHGKQISCEAGGGQRTSVEIMVHYIRSPMVLPAGGSGVGQDTTVFIRQDDSVQLMCSVAGYPEPVIEWTFNPPQTGRVTQGSAIEVSYADVGAYVSCSARNAEGSETSKAMLITGWVEPTVDNSNFHEVNNIITIREGGRGGEDAQLRCQGSGNPMPMFRWYFIPYGVRTYNNASCEETEGLGDSQAMPGGNELVKRVESTCTLRLRSYQDAGSVVCAACQSDGPNLVCDPRLGEDFERFAANSFRINVTGVPLINIERSNLRLPDLNTGLTNGEYAVSYCANPPPLEVYWNVDEQRIDERRPLGRMEALNSEPDTNAACYIARLHVRDFQGADKQKRVVFHVRNSVGSTTHDFGAAQAAGLSAIDSEMAITIGLSLLIVVGVLACLIVGVCCCKRKRMLCFENTKSSNASTGGNAEMTYTNGHATQNVRPDATRYEDDDYDFNHNNSNNIAKNDTGSDNGGFNGAPPGYMHMDMLRQSPPGTLDGNGIVDHGRLSGVTTPSVSNGIIV